MTKRYRVNKDYKRSNDDPISFERGESIIVERSDPNYPGWFWCTDKRGKSGWVHESFIEQEDYRHIATEDYNALELTVKVGDELIGEDERGGWLLAVTSDDRRGWVPVSHVEVM
jgi:hypothetical protein